MKILDDLLGTIKPGKINRVMIGAFTTAVISHRCGLASTVRPVSGEGCHHGVRNPGELVQMNVEKLAEYVLSSNLLEASIGMAAINSSLPDMDAAGLPEINASKIIARKGASKKVAVIGHFPFLGKLKDQVRELLVFEMRMQPGDLSADKIPELLPDCDVVAISSTTFINHTFDQIITCCKPDAYVLMLGPSTPLSPVLFDYGIDAISGTLVTDTDLLLTYLTQGATFQQLQGKKLITAVKGTS